LDPATGTGTFLAEVVKQIHTRFEGQQGIWSNYVENNLIPRLNGFELLMASYAMAHLKLDLLLTETGYKPTRDQRFRVFLTNSLEESHPDAGTLFSHWLSDEANAANQVKQDAPVMVVLGNPPYSVSSTNRSPWILNLIADYKKDLNERKINLDDDYIKFIRLGQYYIDKNGEGVLAYISNNSFIDGVTHRQMRKGLLESFDKIYILDLHGSTMKSEVTPNGSRDENVFDIMQGVSINFFIKSNKKSNHKLSEVFHFDLFGTRKLKYELLSETPVLDVKWNRIFPVSPYFFFVPKDFALEKKYLDGFPVKDILREYNSGVQTKRDDLCIQFNEVELQSILKDFIELDSAELRKKRDLPLDGRDWSIAGAKFDLTANNPKIMDYMYRPFDTRKTFFTGKSKGFHGYPRMNTMRHILQDNQNMMLILCRQQSTFSFQHVFITKLVSDLNSISIQTKEQSYIFPLYLYVENATQITLTQTTRTPNLNPAIVQQIADKLGLAFVPEKETGGNVCMANDEDVRQEYNQTFAPIDILDYIYAVLHSPTYRETYKEFLKIDFPRVPYPKDAPTFWALVALGSELRQLHLLESPKLEKYLTQYPADGDNVVGKIKYENGNVYINEAQYFANVPQVAWEFYIGGYQPAQKWLKDRKGRELGFEDILHYQKIIVALVETDRIMQEIDAITLD
jgi:predicted helicase